MHATIKIVSFLVFGAAVSTGDSQIFLTGLMLVVPLYVLTGETQIRGVMVMLKRLKWLFLSILVIYLFFTPGQLLFTDVMWGPTYEGVRQGFLRVGALVLLVAGVNLLITTTEQDDFLSATMWCLRPLSLFGLDHERLAVRITLTVDAVSQIRHEHRLEIKERNELQKGSRIQSIVMSANHLFTSAISFAESAHVREIILPVESRPPLQQWLIPVALIILFTVIRNVNIQEFI